MALTYRTPMEDIVIAFEPQTQALIASSAAQIYKKMEEGNCSFFNFHLPAIAKRKLSQAGIYLSPFSAVVHSHPVCKTLENHLLYTVLPNYVNSKFFFVGIKERKLQLLKSRSGALESVQCINRFVTSADKLRYTNDFVCYQSRASDELFKHNPGLAEPALRSLVEPLRRHKARYLFFHDELHYWNSKTLASFLQVMEPEVVLATIVYPPELLFKQKKSLNEWCYTFEILGDSLMFYPDGVRSEGYQQPLIGGYLLECNKIVLRDGTTYMVDILCSKYAHHLVAITRGEAESVKNRSFGPFEATASKTLARLCPEYPICLPISCEVVNKVYRYLRTLKKPDVQSAMAKLSQIVAEPTGQEIDFIEDFSKLVIQNESFNLSIAPERLKVFVGTWLGWLPGVLSDKMPSVQALSLGDFIKGLEPFNFTVKLRTLRWDTLYADVLNWSLEGEGDPELVVRQLDRKWVNAPYEAMPQRVSAPYFGMVELIDAPWKPLLEGLEELLLPFVRRAFLNSQCNQFTRTISRAAVSTYVLRLTERCSILRRKVRVGRESRACTPAELLGLGDMAQLTRQLVVRLQQRARFTFWELGISWFVRFDTLNVRYLSDVPMYAKAHKDTMRMMGEVVKDILKKGPRWKIDAPKRYACRGEVKVVDAPSDAAGKEEKGEDFKCLCGLVMPVTKLEYPELSLGAPDSLRGRKAGWYCKTGQVYRYNGDVHDAQGWPEELMLWCEANSIPPMYDCCLYQIYDEEASIGYYADDEELFEVGSSVLTVNLHGTAQFSIKCAKGSISRHLAGPTMFTMPQDFQLSHKHSVHGCSSGRISLTFRCLRKDLATGGVSDRMIEKLEVEESAQQVVELGGVGITLRERDPTSKYVVRQVPGDGSCFWHALGELLDASPNELKRACTKYEFADPALNVELHECAKDGAYVTDAGIIAACLCLQARIVVWKEEVGQIQEFVPQSSTCVLNLRLIGEHFEPIYIKNGCVISSIGLAMGRKECEVLEVLQRRCDDQILKEVWAGEGLSPSTMELVFKCFDVAAHVEEKGQVSLYNPEGSAQVSFTLEDGHLSFNPRKKDPSTMMRSGTTCQKLFPSATLNVLKQNATMITYRPDATRAGLLADSLHDACTGVLGSALFNNKCNLRTQFCSVDGELVIHMIVGTFGSGKSTIFRELMKRAHGKIFDYVSPRRALAEDFKKLIGMSCGQAGGKRKVGQENWTVSTFEKFLERVPFLVEGQVLVIDELQLYPPGYIDLVLMCKKVDVELFLVGDPIQSDYDSEKDRVALAPLEENCEVLLRGTTYKYNITSKRFRNSNFIGRLPCTILADECTIDEPYELRLYIENLKEIEEKYQKVVLVSAFDEKMAVQAYLPKARVLTFGESTGLTFPYGTILITAISERVNDRRWITALSRFSLNLCFVNCSGMSYEQLAMKYRGRALGKFLCKGATKEDLLGELPGEPQFISSFECKIGRDEGVREEKVAGDPWLKTMVQLMQSPDVQEEEIVEAVVSDEWFRTHLPRDELESVRASWVHKILAKESREVRIGDMVSNQFTDDHSNQVGGRQLTNAAERFETIYPRHRANDTVTFIMAVKKRLSFSNPARERGKLSRALPFGKALLNKFLQHVPLRPAHNHRMMEEALWEFEEKKLSKSAATIENHSGRSCRDWPIDMAMLFSKSQLCTKFENRFRVAKAAQSIVCFQHAVLCRFAPYMRYIEKKVHEVLPSRFYIHSGKGLDELNDWVIRGKFDGLCTESDYEAFDASQDEFIMAFELELMKFLGVPHGVIEDYKFIKTSLGSKLGNFAIMRFSGEASTFLFNTLANMLFTFMRYDIKGNEFICFAGDDMCASKALSVVNTHKSFLDKLKLKAKVQVTSKPTFCGWHLCPDGIYKKPQLVLERMCIAMELNNLANCIDNYSIEVGFAYKLGERAVNRMDEEEVSAFYNCVRIIVRNKHLLKSEVRSVFEESKELLTM
ncbi:replicase polyprotein [Yam latent virus]|uniref:Replicase polyprotein n=1 Tax=Yam latent virus TaxID=1592930 RepID=A0A0B4VMT5_9VIRU|nr:replicase polyprotein [Yam latent virus]AJD23365.1 replicase polyprotein [Yam latent virus]